MAANVSNTTPANTRCYPQYSIAFLENYFNTTHYIAAPLNIICILLSVIVNSLILITVYRTKTLRTPSILLLCSLNFKDLSLVNVAQTSTVYESFLYLNNGDFCVPVHATNPGYLLIFQVVSSGWLA